MTYCADLWARMMRKTVEPEASYGCWLWCCGKDRWEYGRLSVWVRGWSRKFEPKTHVLSYLLLHASEFIDDADDLYHAYKNITLSGMQLDHLCVNASCINPDHLQLVTIAENMSARSRRYSSRGQMFIPV